MKYFYMLFVTLSLGYTIAQAQNEAKSLTGTIIDSKKKEAIERASVRILSLPDSTFICSATTDAKGTFSVGNLKKSKYVAVISFLGYNTRKIPFQLTAINPTYKAGKIELRGNSILLKEAVVTGKAIRVVVKGDTIMYNASAYKVAEGSMLGDLVKKLPGAVIDNSGNITINGKQVKKILVNGKEYFSNDPKVAMKNLPANMVDKLKTYDKQSDFKRLTGIDDGNEETVLDLQVKPGMKDGWVGQVKLGGGNESRYEENLTANRFLDASQFSAIGSAHNTNDQGFSGYGGGGGMGGINVTKTLGINFDKDYNKIKIGGDVSYDYTNSKNISEENTTTSYGGSTYSYNTDNNTSINKNDEFLGNLRLEWNPDSTTSVIFSHSYTLGNTRDQAESVSRTYNIQYPYVEGSTTKRGVNYRNGNSKSSGNSVQTNGNIQFTKRLNNRGRNFSIFANYGYNKQNTDQYSLNNIDYFVQDSTVLQNRYVPTNNHGYNYQIGISYSEPVFKQRFLQLRYSYSHQHNTLDKYTYESTDSAQYAGYSNKALESLGNGYYNNYSTHNIGLSLRTIRSIYQYNIGITLKPQSSQTFTYYGLNKNSEPLKQQVLNYSPDFELNYRFSSAKQMRITYRGQSSAPNVTDLQAIISNTDSLNIQYGNPNLKPSYTNSLMLTYNNFMQSTLSSMMAMLNFQNTLNGTTLQTTYISKTGGTVSHLINVNGNWNVNGFMMYNVSLTKNNAFTMNTYTNASYNNQIGYTSVSDTIATNPYSEKFTLGQKSSTSNLSLEQNIHFGYRNDWLDVNLSGGLTYRKVHNNKQTANNNQETWNYTIGNGFNVTLPWKVYLTSDLNYTIRNGYTGASDKNECLWNAQLTKSFLKSNAVNLQLRINDILHQQKSITRNVTNQSVSDVRTNTLGSYCTLSFIWKFNSLGKNSKYYYLQYQ